jgi:hypothetical protein
MKHARLPSVHLTAVAFRALALLTARVNVLLALFLPVFLSLSAAPQQAPTLTIDEDCTAFAFAANGRIIFSVRHVYNQRKYELQRDDFWLADAGGKRRRIINGEKLVRGNAPFSYTVRSFRWAPDGTKLIAELLTTAITSAQGDTTDQTMSLLLDQEGKEIKIAGADSVIPGGFNAAWLSDGVTVGYLVEEMKPRLLYSLNTVRPVAGRGARLFAASLFSTVAWLDRTSQAIGIERDPQFSGKARLVLLDLVKQTRTELAALDGYVGGLTVSPSGKNIAYFRDAETLEVRPLAQPEHAQKVKALYGIYAWARDEQRVLLKPGPERKSGLLEWLRLADGATEEVLHGLTFRDFAISPDGRSLGVLPPGRRTLNVYPLP